MPDRHIFDDTIQVLSVMSRGTVSLLLILWASIPWGPANEPFRWPHVAPLQQSYNFPVASRAEVNLPIRSTGGRQLYLFRCLADYPVEDGTIEGLGCYMILADAKDDGLDSDTLLNDDPMELRIPHGRGQIWSDALEAGCASYPGYGAKRAFRLRGMRITVQVTSVKFGPTREYQNPTRTVSTIRSLGLVVTVASDAGAVSAISEPIPVGPPRWKEPVNSWDAHPDCNSVVPAHVPGDLSDGLLNEQAISGPFPPAARQDWSHLLHAEHDYSSQFAFLRQPMPSDARMFSWAITDAKGQHLYDFACSGYEIAGGANLRGNVRPRSFDRYGTVCGLFLPRKDFNLLADGVDPYSQMNPAQILPGQLFGECGDYPDWGRQRVFHLRGMRLTMHFSDPVFTTGDFAPHALVSARLDLNVEPDPSATSPVAAPPETIYWGILNSANPCHQVLVAPKSGPN